MIEEEDFDKIYNEPERISLKFHEMLACINEDTDNSSVFSDDIDFKDFENFERENEEQEICNERDETIEPRNKEIKTASQFIWYMAS